MLVAEQTVTYWVERVRAEYVEMPGLSLSRFQMQRLWPFDASTCDAVIDRLIASRFLCRRPNDTYARASDDH